VLWNDISWPAPAARLATMHEAYYRAVPDGVVNDRFMPWSPAWELARTAPARRLLDRLAARAAAADKGIVPPKPPMFDVRTPEYTVFDSVQPIPWECVRGIDRSFGHNEQSREELFLGRAELVWSLTDIVAKGGNLLLNVGPRGVDATIAEAQTRRLDWLAAFTGSAGDALFATRPWVHPVGDVVVGGTPPAVAQARYTARDRTVFAIVRRPDPAAVEGRSASDSTPDEPREPRDAPSGEIELLLSEVDATPTTRVTDLAGRELRFRADLSGLTVWTTERPTEEEPVAIALHDVRARPTS
jgi:alpha-L-fucosidase